MSLLLIYIFRFYTLKLGLHIVIKWVIWISLIPIPVLYIDVVKRYRTVLFCLLYFSRCAHLTFFFFFQNLRFLQPINLHNLWLAYNDLKNKDNLSFLALHTYIKSTTKDLWYVLVFFSLFSIVTTTLGEKSWFVCFSCVSLFVALCLFPLPLDIRDWLRLVIVALPRLFFFTFLSFVNYKKY